MQHVPLYSHICGDFFALVFQSNSCCEILKKLSSVQPQYYLEGYF